MAASETDDTLANAGPRPATSGDGAPDVTELVAGRYRIVRWLGSGGMGRVYEAFDSELGERVALKMLRSRLPDDALERFRREVKLTRRIVHDHVARMFDIGEHHGDRFLTMELVDGVPLTRLLGAPLPWPRLQAIALGICDGLAAAHEAGVIHRDLKPDNVLIEHTTDRAVITDFGIARGVDDPNVTQLGSVVGTPRYMAPEQLAGQELDARADLFALGVMLFELATGARPWSGDHAVAIAVAQATQPPRRFASPTAPASFAEIIVSCLALDRGGRPPSALAVRDAIAASATVRGPSSEVAAHRPARPSAPPPVAAPPPSTASFTQAHRETTLAVLAFTSTPADQYLADGLAEDLIDTLSTTSALRVRPAGAAGVAGDQRGADPRTVGAALEVDHVIVGSVRRHDGRLRIAARLISVADGFQLWAQRVDGDEAEVLEISEQLSRGIAQALSTRAAASARPTDPRAVDLYLRARAELRRFWGSHTQAAADLLEQAAALAPSSAPILGAFAYAAAQAWIMSGQPGLADRARRAVERGLTTGHGEASLGAAVVALNTGDLDGAARDLAIALARAPMSAHAHETAGRVLVELEAVAEGRTHLETAAGLDPGRGPIIACDLARLDALAGDWGLADQRIAALVADREPAVARLAVVFDARLAGWRRDKQRLIRAAAGFTPQTGDNATRMIAFFSASIVRGHIEPAEWSWLRTTFIGESLPRRLQVLGLQFMAEMSIMLDDPERCLDALTESFALGLVDITWMSACPLFRDLHHDARWQALRDQVAARAGRMLASFRAAGG